ncbi:MAG: PAS domain-containing protein, partial [Kiritimatiellaceae bacterium]|nr:PAS domain-containing protein [Kiritimatiellaceae bacterium]
MNKKEEKTADLRKIVEKGAGAATLRNLAQMSEEDIAGLVHELETRQVELERKNHELQQTQEDLVAIRDQYAELYDFAPAGYITTDRKGLIVQSNLTFMTLLGIANRPLQKPLMEYIVAEDQKIYQSHRKTVMDTRKPQHCELRLQTKDGNSLWAG